MNVSASFAWCERLCRRHAANFYPTFWLLPRPQRQAMCALYAFMRVTDDLADEPGEPTHKYHELTQWRAATDAALAGEWRHPLHAAFAQTVRRYAIPPAYLHAVIDGVTADLEPVRFASFADLYPYCWRVASAVGLACIHIWGCRNERARAPAEAAGIAFQLTNILRDLKEDAERGRLYLPVDEVTATGLTAETLCANATAPEFHQLMQQQCDRARSYYSASEALVPLLAPPGRAMFGMMSATYRGLLDAIVARRYDVLRERVRLGKWHKLRLFAAALPVRGGWW